MDSGDLELSRRAETFSRQGLEALYFLLKLKPLTGKDLESLFVQ